MHRHTSCLGHAVEAHKAALVLQMHLEVASLLSGPLASRIRGTRRNPDASRLNVDEDEEVKIDHAFDRPLSFGREVALPHGGCMPLQEV